MSTETLDLVAETYTIEQLAEVLQVSRATIDRRRKQNVFPIPELPSIDNRPRWSRAAVKKFLETGQTGRALLKR